MSIISVAVGECGLGVHSALTQYMCDYMMKLEYDTDTSGDSALSNSREYTDRLKSLYFCGESHAEAQELVPRSIVIGSGITRLEHLQQTNIAHRTRKLLYRNRNGDLKKQDSDAPARWSYDDTCTISLYEPSYDVWSSGFYGALAQEEILSECLRKRVETTDMVSGFLSLSSLGGGTGSGAGSFVSKLVYDNYPKARHLTAAVMPFIQGESGMQAMNCILGLANRQEFCDGIILLPNDFQEEKCDKLFGGESKCLNAFNEVHALNLFHGLRPLSSSVPVAGMVRFQQPLDYIVDGLCSYPSLKLLNIDMMPIQELEDYKNTSFGVKQLISQLADGLNSAPTLGDALLSERVSTIRSEVKTQLPNKRGQHKGNTSYNEQGMIQDYVGYYVRNKVNEETNRNYKTAKHVPIISPISRTVKVSNTGIYVHSTFKNPLKTPTSEAFKLIKTVGRKRSSLSKFNVVVSLQLNIGGRMTENLNLTELYQDVLFWKHSTRPMQVSYCPDDMGIFGNPLLQMSNSQTNIPLIDFTSNTAKLAYATNSYIHKYRENGLEMEQIQEALTSVQNILSSYKALDVM